MKTSLMFGGRCLAVVSAALIVAAGLSGCDIEGQDSSSTITPASTVTTTTTTVTTSAAPESSPPASEARPEAPIRPVAEVQAQAHSDPHRNAQEQAIQRARQNARTNAERMGVVFSDDPDVQPRLMWRSQMTQHAGKVYSRDTQSFEFTFYNGGTGPLRISRINASCGCTALDKDQYINKDYMPGEGDTLQVKYTPNSDGNSQKTITIFSNDASNPVVRLRIGAEVVPIAVVDPKNIQPGTLLTNKTHILTFHVKSEDRDAKITGFEAKNTRLTTQPGGPEFGFQQLDPVYLKNDPDYAVSIPVRMTIPAGMMPNGKASVDIRIAMVGTPPGASQPISGSTNTRMLANFAGELRVTQRFARIAESRPDSPFSFTTNVTTISGKEFEVTGVEFSDAAGKAMPGLSYEVARVADAPNPTYAVTVTGKTPVRAGAMRGTLTITSNLAGEGPVQMVFSGFVRNADGEKPASGANMREVKRANGAQ